MGNVWDKGDEIRVEGQFANSAGTLVDPDEVYCQIKAPDGTITSFHYGADPELVKLSTGVYYLDVDVTAVGMWFYRFYSTGDGQGAGEERFKARKTQF